MTAQHEEKMIATISQLTAECADWQRRYWDAEERLTAMRRACISAALADVDTAEQETWHEINGHD